MYGGTARIELEVSLTASTKKDWDEAVERLRRKTELAMPRYSVIGEGKYKLATLHRVMVRTAFEISDGQAL